MSLRGIASAFATVLLVVMAGIGISMLQGHFGWSNTTVAQLYFGVGVLAVLILTYRIRHLAFLYAKPIDANKPLKLAPLHYVGLLTMAAGGILSMSNITGVFPTFPYADKIVLVLGLFINMFTPPLNAQSIFTRSKTPQLPFLPRVSIITGGIILLLAIIGSLIDFTLSTMLPSELGINIGVGCGVILAVCIVAISEKSRQRIGGSITHSGAFQKLIQITWVRICVNLALGFGLGFSATALGYPYAYTHFFGRQASMIVKVAGWHYGSAKRCAKPDIEHSPFAKGDKALCVGNDARLSMPIGASLKLEGRESVFGFNVEKILLSQPDKPE